MTDTGNRVRIFDTTMRDGEQSPGASMNLEEKLRIAEILEEMRVDVIEAGFPIASNGDFEAVREVAKVVTESTVCGLARAGRRDIDRAAEALAPAKAGRIHTFISTSPLHMRVKLQMDPEDVHAAVIDSVSYARKFTDDVEWSCEDGSRTEHDFLCRCVESAIKAGASTINIPDTVGYAVPEEFARADRDALRPGAQHRQGSALRPLPQRPGPRGRQLAERGAGRRAAGGVHHQRTRRARGQRRHGRDRHGDPHPQRPAELRDRREDREHHARVSPCLRRHRLRRAAEQGDRRRQRLRPRSGDPSGRRG